jgi:hypothetical protein
VCIEYKKEVGNIREYFHKSSMLNVGFCSFAINQLYIIVVLLYE